MDTRVYIEDIHGDEIEVDLLVRDHNHNLVGVYMEGPQAGEEVVLDEYMIETLRETGSRILARLYRERAVRELEKEAKE